MNFEFNNAVAMQTLSTKSIRFKAMETLELAKKSLKKESEELSKKFNLTAEEQELEQEKKEPEFLDSIIFDFAILGPLSSFLASNFAIFNVLNIGMMMSCAEAVDESRKIDEDEFEGKIFDYPLGRAKFAIGQEIEDAEEDFNSVSKKMRLGFGATPKAQSDRLYKVLNMLDKLEQQGLNYVDVSEKGSLYDNLKSVVNDVKGYESLFSAGKKEYSMGLAVA